MRNARVLSTVRYNGILIKKIYYFGDIIFLYRVNELLNYSCDDHRAKATIRRLLKNKQDGDTTKNINQ